MYDLGSRLDGRQVTPGTNVLISGPPLTGKRRLGLEILAEGWRQDHGAIVVTTRDSSRQVLDDFEAVPRGEPDEEAVGIVDCVTKQQRQAPTERQRVKYASSPVDMTGIGIKFSEYVDRFSDEDSDGGGSRVLLDSLSTLLMYTSEETAFRFLHVFSSRIEDANGLGVYVIESTAHDETTINTLRPLFDGVIQVDERGIRDVSVPESCLTDPAN
jgi:KaiC/GvpD/RAD55 family RecA-like ATPase